MESIATRVRDVIVENLGITDEECAPTALLGDDLGADSMDLANLVVDLETKFSILISDTDGDGMRTVQDVVNMVERRVVQ